MSHTTAASTFVPDPSDVVVAELPSAAYTTLSHDVQSEYGPRVGRSTQVRVALDASAAPRGERIVATTDGVIVQAGPSSVTVKLLNDTTILFPREVFSSEVRVRLGQPVHYRIMERENGFRYQCFVNRKDDNRSARASRVEALLARLPK